MFNTNQVFDFYKLHQSKLVTYRIVLESEFSFFSFVRYICNCYLYFHSVLIKFRVCSCKLCNRLEFRISFEGTLVLDSTNRPPVANYRSFAC